MNGTRHREVGEYLRRLQRSMGDLPAERRDEILAEIEEHISEDLAERPAATDADVRNVLERVGDPGDIAAEARERFGIKPARRSWTDPAAVILLLIGGFTIIGWFVGVVLLWISDAWNTRDKIIGTLVVPGGLAGALGVGLASSGGRGASCGPVEITVAPGACATVPSTDGNVVGLILAVLVVIAPIATAVYLSLRLRRARLASLVEGEEQ
jgi:HAAS